MCMYASFSIQVILTSSRDIDEHDKMAETKSS